MTTSRATWRLLWAVLVTGLITVGTPAVSAFAAGGGPNLATGKAVSASSSNAGHPPNNANDGNRGTYWESTSNGWPQWLQVDLGATVNINRIVLRLPSRWSARTETVAVRGSTTGTSFTDLVAATGYVFNQANANTVTISFPTSATRYVRLNITANTGQPGGQISEFEVYGPDVGQPEPPTKPDLTVTAASWNPTSPTESTPITLAAAVRNTGASPSTPTNVNFYVVPSIGPAVLPPIAATAPLGALAPGMSVTVTATVGARAAGSHVVIARVDEANTVVEQNELNNSYTNPTAMVVRELPSSDLVLAQVTWTPADPKAGDTVAFSVHIRNQGTVATSTGAHGIAVTIINSTGAVVHTTGGTQVGAIPPAGTAGPIGAGTWTATSGQYTVRVALAPEENETPPRQANNAGTYGLSVGSSTTTVRGATMPYEMYEAEDGTVGGGGTVVGPSIDIGDLAGEASGRRAVTLNTTGAFVEWTTRAPTNTLVTRFSIPDAAAGGGIDSTLNLYIDGTFRRAIDLTSKYTWLYGNEYGPGNSPSFGAPRHIYDEANVLLDLTVPAGSRIRLQKDGVNATTYAIDFVNLELATPLANPDPARYAVPTGFAHPDVQNALDRARLDPNFVGVYLPAGNYDTNTRFLVYGKPVAVVGAGPWYTRFHAPRALENTDVGIRVEAGANGSTFANFAYFGNYTSRIDGPGKVFDFANVARITLDNIWTEHTMSLAWGGNADNLTIRNNRIRNTFAGGVTLTDGSTNNVVSNNDARATGDDSFALFGTPGSTGSAVTGNRYEGLSATLAWHGAGVAVYNGYGNTVRNVHVADTLAFSGVTISSVDFAMPTVGFRSDQPTTFDNMSIVRGGGHFNGPTTLPGIWVISGGTPVQGIRVSNVDIVDSSYTGIMFQSLNAGGQPLSRITDTTFTNVSISGTKGRPAPYADQSGFGIWCRLLPGDQGGAAGDVTFVNPRFSDNLVNVKNECPNFRINIAVP